MGDLVPFYRRAPLKRTFGIYVWEENFFMLFYFRYGQKLSFEMDFPITESPGIGKTPYEHQTPNHRHPQKSLIYFCLCAQSKWEKLFAL